MIPGILRNFISRLLKFTDDGNIKWEEGSAESYFCNHNSYELHIRHSFDDDTGESVFHFLMKSKGRDAIFSVTDKEDDYFIMKNLYESVSVQAAGFDNIEKDFFK